MGVAAVAVSRPRGWIPPQISFRGAWVDEGVVGAAVGGEEVALRRRAGGPGDRRRLVDAEVLEDFSCEARVGQERDPLPAPPARAREDVDLVDTLEEGGPVQSRWAIGVGRRGAEAVILGGRALIRGDFAS